MSNADLSDSVSSTPSIATTFRADDLSTAVPAGNILDVLSVDSTDNNDNGIQTRAAANDVTVQLTNRLQGSATSTNASNADTISFPLGGAVAVYRFRFDVAGRSTAGVAVGEGAGYTVFGSARTDGAAATVIGTALQDVDEDAALNGCTVSFVASVNSVILRLNGIAGETISFNAVGTFVVV
jgi:hypothetical protein